MNVPTIFDLLDRVAFLRGAPAVAIVLLAAFVAVAAWDLRLVVLSMFVHYLFGWLLLVDVLDPRLSVVYLIAGVFTSLILLVTGWQIRWGRSPIGPDEATTDDSAARRIGRFAVTDRQLARLALAGVGLLVALWLSRTPGTWLAVLPEGMAYLEPAIAGLVIIGLVGMAAAVEPLSGGVGLLLFLSGFGLYYSLLDPSIALAIGLVGLQLIVVLAASYLAQARYLPVDLLD